MARAAQPAGAAPDDLPGVVGFGAAASLRGARVFAGAARTRGADFAERLVTLGPAAPR
ncbi:hypothetical protein [Deinococcus sp.]|uniref:hypothetical protein n=1 Tax=Deinococcus sp. TaxID=47478 RepID=UPI003B59CDF9